jgi:hypothetical protein
VRDISRNPYHQLLTQGNPICTSTVILKRPSIELQLLFSEDPEKAGWEDYDFWMRVADQGFKFIKLNQYLTLISKNENNFSDSEQALKNLLAIKSYLEPKTLHWITYARGKAYHEQGSKNIARVNFFEVLCSKNCSLKLRIKSMLMILKTFT